MEETLNRTRDPIRLAGEIVAAYVSNNAVPAEALPELITVVHAAVSDLSAVSLFGPEDRVFVIERPTQAQIQASIREDSLQSFIDGRSYKILKRHLSASGLDPRSYRQRYGLPSDYPMVAPAYAEKRSQIAKAIGLGVRRVRADRGGTGTGG
jgi:predicted transcriptional regulator